jgi:hypothetical protein
MLSLSYPSAGLIGRSRNHFPSRYPNRTSHPRQSRFPLAFWSVVPRHRFTVQAAPPKPCPQTPPTRRCRPKGCDEHRRRTSTTASCLQPHHLLGLWHSHSWLCSWVSVTPLSYGLPIFFSSCLHPHHLLELWHSHSWLCSWVSVTPLSYGLPIFFSSSLVLVTVTSANSAALSGLCGNLSFDLQPSTFNF